MTTPGSDNADPTEPENIPQPPPPPKPRRRGSKRKKIVLGLTFVCLLLAVGFYHFVVSGGLIARQKPSATETAVAQWLVNLSIPKEAAAMQNPLDPTAAGANAAAGRELYQTNCIACHGYDGRGKTQTASGLYPPPANLAHAAVVDRKRTDGELFYLIRNGVRNTGMPGWQLPDQQTWQLVSYIRTLPVTVAVDGQPSAAVATAGVAHYVGSASCAGCHSELYRRWSKTPMANVVRDPRQHPDAILPDFSKPDPLVKFAMADIDLVYGSKWKQRYFKKVGNDYFVYPAQWDVTHGKWKPYVAKEDWWVSHYPPGNAQRPTSALCDGCHSVNFNIADNTVTEWNVGCERCHGPGSEHVKHPTSSNIANAARMGYVAANDICIQCHSQGRPLNNPIAGKYFDWPVGYDITGKLADHWKLEDHTLGQTTFTHFADGTAHKNRMQGNDFVQSQMYTHGVACFTCHDVHGTNFSGNLRKPANTLCLDCHSPGSPNGPRAPTIAEHTHHKPGSTGSECIACHMPLIAQTIGDVNVRSHTFKFVSPAVSESLKVPNACNVCHTDKSTKWATDSLADWADRSPWRVGK